MTSQVEQFRIWNRAKDLSSKFQYDKSLELYRSIETDMSNLRLTDKSERDNMFYQARFFGDYCGVLCDIGLYTEAKEKGDLALKLIEQGNFPSLKYVYYNIGNIFLFQKEYAQACSLYETALEGATYFYTSVNDYLVNYGIALYYLGIMNKAKEKFQLAIKSSKDTKYNRNFEPFFFMSKICELENEGKESRNYKKMYLTRLKKYLPRELECVTSTLECKEEILADYETSKQE
jgi:tetratricopeptide (TPR) repeat protein